MFLHIINCRLVISQNNMEHVEHKFNMVDLKNLFNCAENRIFLFSGSAPAAATSRFSEIAFSQGSK